MKTVQVRAYPRLHASLVDLGNATHRKYGGIGFSIDSPTIDISARKCDATDDIVTCVPIDIRTRAAIMNCIDRFRTHFGGHIGHFQVSIDALPPQHVGFGVSTALALGLLTSLATVTEVSCSDRLMQRLSGRGGTSGVGVHTFFLGGMVVDLGHPADGTPHGPSASGLPLSIPLLGNRFDMPMNWRVLLFVAPGDTIEGANEVAFFRSVCPIPRLEALEALAIVHHGLVPALMESCFEVFRECIHSLHETGFKRLELGRLGAQTRNAVDQLRKCSRAAVGLSSMGPLMYCVLDSDDETEFAKLKTCAASLGCRDLGVARFNNRGFEIVSKQ